MKFLLERKIFHSKNVSWLESTCKKLELTNLLQKLQKYRESLDLPEFEIKVTCLHQYLTSREDRYSFFEIGRSLSDIFRNRFDAIFEDFTQENTLILRIPNVGSLRAVQEGVQSGTLAENIIPLLMTNPLQENVDRIQVDEEQYNRVRNCLLKNTEGKTEESLLADFRTHLEKADLSDHYPAKITLKMATKVRMLNKASFERPDIPFLFLIRLTSLDRRVVLPETLNFNVSVRDFIFDLLHCSDDFLRQHILEKLAACQLAVPVIIPDPVGGTPVFLLWALRRIVKKWKDDKDPLTPERSMVTEPVLTVVFLRVGRLPVSKSLILNNMFGRAQGNTTVAYFMTKEEDYRHDATFSKGSIEAHWYVPLQGRDDEILDKLILFLNLRGDSKEFPNQVTFACKVANMVFILVEDEQDSQNKALTDRIQLLSPKVMTVCLKKRPETTDAQTTNKLTVTNNRIECKVDDKNIDLSIKLCELIKETSHCSSSKNYQCMEDWAKTCQSQGEKINVDEDNIHCKKALEKTEQIFNEMQSLSVEEIKAKHLILQKLQLEWVKWDQKRPTRYVDKPVEIQEDIISQKKMEIRRKQLSRGLTKPMDIFYNVLHDLTIGKDGPLLDYFMAHFQAKIDKMVKKDIPPHIAKIGNLESELVKLKLKRKEGTSTGNVRNLEKDIEKIKKLILSESEEYNLKHIGFEHFMRELSHLCEAQHLGSQTADGKAKLAAMLLIRGYPLEVLDGDSTYVSIKWISSVLEDVNRTLKSPKIFVISVIGVQSSGKSTLLNCMFGVRFTVRAGKCTRGLFLQMLEVDRDLQESLGFQYLFIIDTEGLQSPDRLVKNDVNFDNRLATLAMCVVDLSIINISQETIGADMVGILQIAAHALIRMKMVHLVSHYRIIHQRVSDVNAAGENRTSWNMIRGALDKAALAAAKEENIEGIKEFSDVFNFTEDDNLYIPCLWMGNMCPPYHGYSDAILNLKSQILSMARYKGVAQFTLPKFINRLKDIWDALKKEDFVFNFQNSFNVLSYQQFRLEHNKWIAQMRTAMMDWELRNKESVKDGNLEVYRAKLNAEIKGHLGKVWNEIDEYVSKHTYEDEVLRQQDTFKIASDNIAEEIKRTILDNFDYFLKTEKQKACLPIYIKKCKNKLRKEAKETALKIRSEHPTLDLKSNQDNLHQTFENLLKRTTETLRPEYESLKLKKEDIISACENSLTALMENTKYNLKFQEIIKRRGGIVLTKQHLTPCKFTGRSEEEGKEKTTKQRTPAYQFSFFRGLFSVYDYIDRERERKELIKNMASEELRSFETDERFEAFDKNRIEKFFTVFLENLRSHMQLEEEFSLQTLVDTCQRMADISIDKQRHFESKFSLDKLIDEEKTSLKTDFFTFFDNTIVTERAAEKLFSEICTTIRKEILDHLNVKLLGRLRRLNCFIDREYLIGTILCEICNEENGPNYLEFVSDLNKYITQWLQKRIKEEVTMKDDSKPTEQSELWIERTASDKLNHLKEVIENCLTKTESRIEEILSNHEVQSSSELEDNKECNTSIETWQSVFTDMCRAEGIVMDFGPMIFDSVHNNNFTEFLLKRIKKMSVSDKDLHPELTACDNIENAEMLLSKLEIKPHLEILKQVQGCSEVCPFCKVGCHRQGEHSTHSATLHYPEGLTGFRNIYSQKLTVDICTSLVASDVKYKFKDYEEFRPYRDYKNEFPTWDIKPIQGDQPTKHWKWVMSTFNQFVAENYHAKPGVIPDGWKEIKKCEVLSSLKQRYNLD